MSNQIKSNENKTNQKQFQKTQLEVIIPSVVEYLYVIRKLFPKRRWAENNRGAKYGPKNWEINVKSCRSKISPMYEVKSTDKMEEEVTVSPILF